jgi:cellulose synthase/poly-beta-1,6-N-acetylglucosamine synthase-like glycosyltransferase
MPRLAAYSELVEHRVFERLRARLGWPVRLRGTGMAFRRDVLEVAAAGLHTPVEDLELTLRLVDRGYAIRYAEGAAVLDPKPVDAPGVVRQRSRWFRGQMMVLHDYPGTILRIAARGPAGWLLLYDALARPKALVLPVQLLVASAVLALSASTHSALWALLGLALLLPILVDATAYLVGIGRLASRGELLQVLVYLPAYTLTWARSIWLALRSDEAWLSARPIALRPPEPDRRHAPESS